MSIKEKLAEFLYEKRGGTRFEISPNKEEWLIEASEILTHLKAEIEGAGLTDEETSKIWWSQTDIAREDIKFWVNKADSYPKIKVIAQAQLQAIKAKLEEE